MTVRIPVSKFSMKRNQFGMLTKRVLIFMSITVGLVLKAFTEDASNLVDGVLKLIILTEGISVFVNLMSIQKKEEIESQDYLYLIMKLIRRFFDNHFQKILKKYDEKDNNNSKSNNIND